MKTEPRAVHHNIDPEILYALDAALDAALEACELGDVPDKAIGIYANLLMDGWDLVKSAKE